MLAGAAARARKSCRSSARGAFEAGERKLLAEKSSDRYLGTGADRTQRG